MRIIYEQANALHAALENQQKSGMNHGAGKNQIQPNDLGKL